MKKLKLPEKTVECVCEEIREIWKQRSEKKHSLDSEERREEKKEWMIKYMGGGCFAFTKIIPILPVFKAALKFEFKTHSKVRVASHL